MGRFPIAAVTLEYPLTAVVRPVVRPGREIPKFYRDVVNILIDQGWEYIPRTRLGHSKIVPADPTKQRMIVASTTASITGRAKWLAQARRNGAILDEEVLDRITRRDSRARLKQALRDAEDPTPVEREHIAPVTTHGAWWRPEEPAPAPEPPAKPLPMTPPPPRLDPNAQGAVWTLGQARKMLREGYHVNKVVAKTGWGKNWFSDLVDHTGYISLR